MTGVGDEISLTILRYRRYRIGDRLTRFFTNIPYFSTKESAWNNCYETVEVNLGANWIMGERNPLLKYLQAAGLQAVELFETDEVKIIDIVDDEFIDITDEAEEYFVKDSAIISMLMTMTQSILIVTNFVASRARRNSPLT